MIYISAGHGSKNKKGVFDNGAMANGAKEYDEVQKIAAALVERNPSFLKLIPFGMNLADGTKTAWIRNHLQPTDMLFELHMDAASELAHGCTFFYHAAKDVDKTMADAYGKLFSKATGIWYRGVKPDTSTRHGRLGIIRDVNVRSFLIELCFITNKEDLELARAKAVSGLEAMLQLNHKPMTDRKLEQWEMDAMQFISDMGIMKNERPLETMYRAEVAELLRKFCLFLDSKYKK